MPIFKTQLEIAGQSLAQSAQYLYAWDEAMNMDDIDEIVKAFRQELKELNGE